MTIAKHKRNDRLPVLEAAGLHRFYRQGESEVAALKDVDISLNPGELLAVMGPSGSGKSTLLNLLAGLDNPDGGSVRVHGERLSHVSAKEQSLLRACLIGVMTQTSGMIDHLSVLANVELAQSLRTSARSSRIAHRRGWIFRSTFGGTLTPEELLTSVGLGRLKKARPSRLSGGETARANLAVALAGGPYLLLADEPTAEVSHEEETLLLDLLSEIRPLEGSTVIVTHSHAVAQRADRVLQITEGRVSETR